MTKHEICSLTAQEVDSIVKISGTNFDRRRKLTDRQIKRIRTLYFKRNMTYQRIADKFDVDVRTIRYHVDPEYRRRRIDNAKMYQTPMDAKEYIARTEERGEYKRHLILRKKLSIN